MTMPAVTLRSSPVMEAEPPEARNTQAAATCSFLASDAAASITGEDLNVNAGVVMY